MDKCVIVRARLSTGRRRGILAYASRPSRFVDRRRHRADIGVTARAHGGGEVEDSGRQVHAGAPRQGADPATTHDHRRRRRQPRPRRRRRGRLKHARRSDRTIQTASRRATEVRQLTATAPTEEPAPQSPMRRRRGRRDAAARGPRRTVRQGSAPPKPRLPEPNAEPIAGPPGAPSAGGAPGEAQATKAKSPSVSAPPATSGPTGVFKAVGVTAAGASQAMNAVLGRMNTKLMKTAGEQAVTRT